jgi:hypothetical protein
VAVLAPAPAAEAATPFTAGVGSGHDVAVDSVGTGHVVWVTDETADKVAYCRVPAGGTACSSVALLPFPGLSNATSPSPHAQVFTPALNRVVILAACSQCGTAGGIDQRTFRFISTDNGDSFPTVDQVGSLQLNGQASYYDTSSVALSVSGRLFQGQASGPASTSTLPLGSTASSVYDASTVVWPTAEKAIYAVNNLDDVEYRVFTNASPPGVSAAELNNTLYWSAPKYLPAPEGNNDETRLGSGPNGMYLTYRYGQPTENRIGLRKFDFTTSTFGMPVYVEGADPIENSGIGESMHSQDAGGRLHVVWRSLYDGNRLRYTHSDTGGANFTAAANLAMRETFLSPMVEAGPTGTGFAVWQSTGSTIRVVPIDPQPEPTGPGGPGGPDTTPPTAGGLAMGDPTLTPGQGTSFTFTSSEAGIATLTVQKQVKGLKVRRRGSRRLRCVPQTRRRLRALRRSAGSDAAFRRLLRQRRCKAYKKIGSISQAVTPGNNTIVFSGRIAGRPLRAGRYRALLVIRDSAGNLSRVERIRFRVLRRRH